MKSFEKPHGLFINPSKANCSIYESGRMIYECLLLSDKYKLDYLEVNENKRYVSDTYDFYTFNYHHTTMGWLDTNYVHLLPGLKIVFVLEVSPNNPFILCPDKDFNIYCALDPTINITDKKVYAFSRPLEVPVKSIIYKEKSIPIIGSFGFATQGKGFELVVDAVNKEFDEAIIKINIPTGTYADDIHWNLHKQNYAEYLANLCKKTAKKGIEVVVTHNYMSKEELIEWCGQNTLNCFLYDRDMPGLAATTDQAISCGRPLAVSDNTTFRHIIQYIKPYPYRTLKESIKVSRSEVLRIQKEWAPTNFAKKFEKVLSDFNLFNVPQRIQTNTKMVELKRKLPPTPLIQPTPIIQPTPPTSINDEIRNFVMEGYRNILKRDPEPGGLDLHVNLITLGKLTKEQFLDALRQSEEYGIKFKH